MQLPCLKEKQKNDWFGGTRKFFLHFNFLSATLFLLLLIMNKIENLLFINNKDQNVLPNLVNAMTSHKWQFSKFGKDKIRLLLKNPNIRNYLEQLIPNLSKEDSLMLGKIVSENSAK
jgi:hypothetical protein